ncbi:MAG: UDP-N-acetylmuramate dehydrogenase [Thermomonas hydrothermalis]|uniref:UDP-N-acetylmuramate dehydrogenase n=1 Tax=Thermomonas hydrothermalis TaxID=213588 RepID=UPI0023567F1C|nr:UDP-N-acetylmuramate dehydrogenase [Thermomonas hydrothermalis]MCL6619363.1 UDP-N-acetylmuramate dehydrogenase [Thermomonas hydrothermalis]
MSHIQAPGYRITENARLDARNTFGVRARAPMLVEVTDTAALPELAGYAMLRDPALLVLGGGSNLLLAADPPGAVLTFNTCGISLLDASDRQALVRAEAGVVWHDFVLWTLGHGLSGLENLALIPGTVGAAPIQNIGAYGVEVCECVHAVEAFDRHTGRFVRLSPADCAFAYRDSVFKQQPDRYWVTAVEFSLSRQFQPRLDYAGLAAELQAMGVTDPPRPAQVAEAVIRIRRRKLPNPAVLGNAGSFFKNPLVPQAQAEALRAEHPALPVYPAGDGVRCKLSAAWLIEQCGWKGHRDGDAGVSAQHALVLVNHGNASGADVLALARRIAASVQARFGVAIEPEPRLVGATW